VKWTRLQLFGTVLLSATLATFADVRPVESKQKKSFTFALRRLYICCQQCYMLPAFEAQ